MMVVAAEKICAILRMNSRDLRSAERAPGRGDAAAGQIAVRRRGPRAFTQAHAPYPQGRDADGRFKGSNDPETDQTCASNGRGVGLGNVLTAAMTFSLFTRQGGWGDGRRDRTALSSWRSSPGRRIPIATRPKETLYSRSGSSILPTRSGTLAAGYDLHR